MLVLQPNITRFTDWTGASVKVSVGRLGVKVGVGDGVVVFSAVTGDITVTFEDGVTVLTKTGGGIMNGVGVTIPGVSDGMGVQTGNVCGATPQTSHELINTAKKRKQKNFFILLLYTGKIMKKEAFLQKGLFKNEQSLLISSLFWRSVFFYCCSEFSPARFYEYRSVRKYYCWNALVSVVDIHNKISCCFVAFQPNAQVFNVVGFEEGFCPMAIGAVFSCVHDDLRWICVVQVAQEGSPRLNCFFLRGYFTRLRFLDTHELQVLQKRLLQLRTPPVW